MYRKKNILLIIILMALMVLSSILLSRGKRKQRLALDETYFSVLDTAGIDRIEIQSSGSENLLTRAGERWQINGKYMLDPSMKTVLLTVLTKVRAQRPVPTNKLVEISGKLSMNGIQVNIYSNNELVQSFLSGGNGVSISYFKKGNEDPYIVHLPGYDSYVSGIFEVSKNDWRDRFVFSTNWIGLKELSLEYPEFSSNNFKIETTDTHLIISGASPLDTTAMMEYIELFRYFQVDQFISAGDNPQYDSIFKTTPYALLTVDDTSFEAPLIIKYFILEEKNPLMPCLIGDQPALMSTTRIKPIFKKQSDFVKKSDAIGL